MSVCLSPLAIFSANANRLCYLFNIDFLVQHQQQQPAIATKNKLCNQAVFVVAVGILRFFCLIC